ncbi:MAG: glycosyltransferase [Chloroflexi bacterium]|nr:glycosyltransferase [Chloroflexota bacterium]
MDVRPRVLVVPSWYPSEHEPVAGVFVRAQAQAAIGCADVAVLHVAAGPGDRWTERVDDGLLTYRVSYRRPPRGDFAAYCLAAWRALRRVEARWRPDLLHAHVTLPAGFAAAVYGALRGLPLVLTEHAGPYAALLRTRRAGRLLARWTVARAARLVTVSGALRQQMEAELGIALQPPRWQRVPVPVDTARFRPGRVPDDAPLLYAGALLRAKGLYDLLDALALLRRHGLPARLLLAGDGPERAAAVLGLTDVSCTGWLPQAELAERMATCACLVLPSHGETFGSVLVEAMACGRPVVATRCGGPEEIVRPGLGVLVPPRAPQALAAALAPFVAGVARVDGAALRAAAERAYSLAAVGARLGALYREVVAY